MRTLTSLLLVVVAASAAFAEDDKSDKELKKFAGA
jgi:hypothetical protein